MSTERTHPYLFWGLVCAIAVSGLVIAAILFLPIVYRHWVFNVVANNGTVEDVKYYIERGVSVNEKDHNGRPLIHYAVRYNPNIDVLKYLVKQGADVNAKEDNAGWTSLHYAAASHVSNPEVFKYLIDNGADVNAKEDNGRTPLHLVAVDLTSNIENLKYLVEHGADVNVMDSIGKTPLDYVIVDKEKQTFLREAGAKRGEELPK